MRMLTACAAHREKGSEIARQRGSEAARGNRLAVVEEFMQRPSQQRVQHAVLPTARTTHSGSAGPSNGDTIWRRGYLHVDQYRPCTKPPNLAMTVAARDVDLRNTPLRHTQWTPAWPTGIARERGRTMSLCRVSTFWKKADIGASYSPSAFCLACSRSTYPDGRRWLTRALGVTQYENGGPGPRIDSQSGCRTGRPAAGPRPVQDSGEIAKRAEILA
jgi:hypothetical protein